MQKDNIKVLENLSLYSHFGGMFSVFLGLVTVFVDFLNGDFGHIQIGIYIFATGYAFVKISQRLTQVLIDERYWEQNSSPNPFSR
jgi:hypothetical protein